MTKTELKQIRIAENKIIKKLNHFEFSKEFNAFVCLHCAQPHPLNQLTECDFVALELAPIGMAVLILRGHLAMQRLNTPFLVRRVQTAWSRTKRRAQRDHVNRIVHLQGICHTTSLHILNDWISIGDATMDELLTFP